MKMAQQVATSLPLHRAVSHVARTPLDHFPKQVIYQYLTGSPDLIADGLVAELSAGFSPSYEVISMPRRGFGPRPVVLLSGVTRVLYSALVSQIAPALPDASRGEGKYAALRSFGTGGSHEYVVDLDFASCYEFIDHDVLFNELILRTMDFSTSSALRDLLNAVSSRGRGLPQMQIASDRLADAYLSIIDRQLARAGFESLRFADDIRVRVDNWEDANRVIEDVAEHARELGLILSANKTAIHKRETLQASDEEEAEIFSAFLDEDNQSLAVAYPLGVGAYGEVNVEVIPPEEKEALREASSRLLLEWDRRRQNKDAIGMQKLGRYVGPSLMRIIDDEQEVSGTRLANVVFSNPQRLEEAIGYVIGRAGTPEGDGEDHLSRLLPLIDMGRQSPWAKLTMLAAVHIAQGSDNPRRSEVISWAREQLADRHESVRVEAAWTLASMNEYRISELKGMWQSASPVSYPGIAASVAKHFEGIDVSKEKTRAAQISAVRDVDYATKAGASWAQS